ncbi:hypothetical protein [Micromonospora viridifaciens]|uniref:hypothetical protein n=1 Tax=Micromonospora viridifaciens TaxID=1881 RepID=UPI0012FDAB83|nr:hypothetical protein [Micromonospora viridifaciens]
MRINPIPKLTVDVQDGRVDAWQSIDDLIVQRRILPAMQAIREAEGCSLHRPSRESDFLVLR